MKPSVPQIYWALSIATSFGLLSTQAQAIPDTSVAKLLNLSEDNVAQVSSVSELTDVDPNNWAFQALKSLVERYGCIEGYPSKKYLGNRPLSRYEFAAGLNACLDKIGEQITAATVLLASKEDLSVVHYLRFWVGPFLQDIALLDTNRFAGADDENTFITAFHNQNQLFSGPIQFGSGAAFDWKISDQFSWRTLYITRDGGKSFGFGDSGLTGGTSKLATELEFRPSLDSAIRLQYAFINAQNTGPGSTIFGGGTNAFLVGTDPTFVSLGAAGLRNAQTSVLGINADWAITPTVGIFGRYATGDTTLAGVGNVNSSNYHFGFAFSDLFAQGNQLGISYGQPIRINSSPVGPDSGTENALEVYYRLKINPRFSLTPCLQLYFTPGNVAGNPTVTVGSLQQK